MPTTEPLAVAVCSPQPVVRNGLLALLERHPERFRLVDACGGAPDDQPEVVLYDVVALTEGIADLTGLLSRTQGKVLAVARDLRPDLARRAIAAGVDGCVSLGVDEDELVEAVAAAGTDDVAAAPPAGPADPAGRTARPGRRSALSAREVEVLALIAQGRTNLQIADELFLSINSVKTYVRNAYVKIGAGNRSQAVAWAIRNGVDARTGR